MRNVTLKKYSYWPNTSLLLKTPYDEYDYICMAFELSSFIDKKKEDNIYIVMYLFVDCYEKKLNLSFDIPIPDSTTDNFFYFKQEHIKPSINKVVNVENKKNYQLYYQEYRVEPNDK